MMEHSLTYFAVLVCLYSFFEFFLKRTLWKPSGEHTGRVATIQAVVLLFTLLIGTSGFSSVTLTIGSVLVVVAYSCYTLFSRKYSNEKLALENFLCKQAFMGILLYILWRIALPITVHDWYAQCEGVVLAGFGEKADVLRDRFALVLSIVASYIFMIDGGTRIVKGIVGKFPVLYQKVLKALNEEGNNKETPTESEENVGEWIGILERLIALTFVLTGSFTAIAFVLTAKSIARFNELGNKDFAEYYLLGTSGSMIAAIGVGVLVKIIFGF